MPKIELDAVDQTNATGYPDPFHKAVEGRWYRRLAPAGGLTLMGASHVTLKPGAWSSQRHWHEGEDELVIMLSGEAALVDDHGETMLKPGDICAFAAGDANGHHIINRSDNDCVFVAISAGDRGKGGSYSDIDMMFTAGSYIHKDGTPYPKERLA